MKEFLKKVFNKNTICFLVGAVLGALGMSIDNALIEKVVCLFNVAGCQ